MIVQSFTPGDPCPMCGKPLERAPNMFFWRGTYQDGCVCPNDRGLWPITGEEITPLKPGPHHGALTLAARIEALIVEAGVDEASAMTALTQAMVAIVSTQPADKDRAFVDKIAELILKGLPIYRDLRQQMRDAAEPGRAH